MADVYPVDYSSAVGRVRKLIPDVRLVDGEYIFTDEELESFILDEYVAGYDEPPVFQLWRAAAMAMIAIANDENLILKKIVTEDLQTDGPAVARQLQQSADRLLNRADDAEGAMGVNESLYVVDYQPTPSRHYPLTPGRYGPYAR